MPEHQKVSCSFSIPNLELSAKRKQNRKDAYTFLVVGFKVKKLIKGKCKGLEGS